MSRRRARCGCSTRASTSPNASPTRHAAPISTQTRTGRLGVVAAPVANLAASEANPMVRKNGCMVATNDACGHRVATAYMLAAGPPTPAVTFMNPATSPAPTRKLLRSRRFSRPSKTDAVMPSAISTPMEISSHATDTTRSTRAPGTMPSRAAADSTR